jgi:replicative DNA helicase Mcm
MDASEQILKFQEYIEDNLRPELLRIVRSSGKSIVLDFSDLSKFSLELVDDLLESPEEVVRAAELAVEQLEGVKLRVRLTNLPSSQYLMIKNIRSEHLGKLLVVEGIVRQKSDVRPQVTTAKFECPSCGQVLSILQLDSQFKEPKQCGCGRKGKFRLIDKALVDAQGIVLEEAPEDLEGGEQPKRMNIFLKEDLVSPISEKKTNPGSRVRVIGTVKEIPIVLRSGSQSTRFDLLIEANQVESVEEDFGDVEISKDEEEAIHELSRDSKVYDKFVRSVAPSIYGHDKVKEALVLQIFAGVRKHRKDGSVTRGDMHVLLVGDPGSGKSMLLKRMSVIAPKGRYVSGKGASGAGLTAAVVRDEFLKGWALEAGALVLANNGVCFIDELDKMSPEDRGAMHEALEQQTVTISKANIQATLRAETTVLAAANPKFGRFDPYGIIAEQIDLPPSLINRFDLIFPIKDLPNLKSDENIASFILKLHQSDASHEGELPTEFLTKYIAYAKQRIKPRLTDSALNVIKEYYVRMRNSFGGEGEVKAIPISARQLEALIRLSEASAKVRLSKEATTRDARRAIDLLEYCLGQVARDSETGVIDIDRLSTGISASQRGGIHLVKEIISDLENKIGRVIPIDDLLKEAEAKGVSEDKIEEILEKLKRSGDIFEPKRGFISKI